MSNGAFKEYGCASKGCSAVIVLHTDVVRKLRRTKETFFCPAGHSQWFPGKTDEQKKIDALEQQVDSLKAALDRRWSAWTENLTCPTDWCPQHGYVYSSIDQLLRHLERKHAMTMQWQAPLAIEAVTGS